MDAHTGPGNCRLPYFEEWRESRLVDFQCGESVAEVEERGRLGRIESGQMQQREERASDRRRGALRRAEVLRVVPGQHAVERHRLDRRPGVALRRHPRHLERVRIELRRGDADRAGHREIEEEEELVRVEVGEAAGVALALRASDPEVDYRFVVPLRDDANARVRAVAQQLRCRGADLAIGGARDRLQIGREAARARQQLEGVLAHGSPVILRERSGAKDLKMRCRCASGGPSIATLRSG